MELRQLQYVLAVAEEASFTRAAARAHVAQPAISQQIAQLERELGEKLFDRSDRKVRLTPAGEAFLPFARSALQATSAGRDAVTSLRGELAGRLTVGTIPSPPEWLIARLGQLRSRHPKVRLVLRSGNPEELAADVTAGTLDVALIGVSGERLPAGPAGQRLRFAVASWTVDTEPLVIVAARDHPMAKVAEVSLPDLRDEPMVTLVPGMGLRTVLESACAEAGFAPQIHGETDDLTILAHLAAHGFGLALIPRSAAESAGPDLAIIAVRGPAPARPMALIWHRHRQTATTQAFLELLEAHDEATHHSAPGGRHGDSLL